jgi:hypothetical protein
VQALEGRLAPGDILGWDLLSPTGFSAELLATDALGREDPSPARTADAPRGVGSPTPALELLVLSVPDQPAYGRRAVSEPAPGPFPAAQGQAPEALLTQTSDALPSIATALPDSGGNGPSGPDGCPTLTLSGTFNMDFVAGSPGEDLLAIVGNDNGWTITLFDVTYMHFDDGGKPPDLGTRVHAGSFQFEFSGVDAELLNDVVGQYFTQGGFPEGGFFEVWGFVRDSWRFDIRPPDPSTGVSFALLGSGSDSQPTTRVTR